MSMLPEVLIPVKEPTFFSSLARFPFPLILLPENSQEAKSINNKIRLEVVRISRFVFGKLWYERHVKKVKVLLISNKQN